MFEDIAKVLCKAVWGNALKAGKSSASTSQAALNATASKLNGGRYSSALCTYPGCPCLKSHAMEDCWMKEREEKKKKERNRQKAKKAKKRAASSSSDSETGSNSDTNSEPKKEK